MVQCPLRKKLNHRGSRKQKLRQTFNKLGWKKQKGKDVALTKQTKKSRKVMQLPTRLTVCFICNDPHKACDYPKCEKLTTLVSGDDKVDSISNGPSRVNPLQLLNVIHGQPLAPKSLMFVQTLVNSIWSKP